MTIPDGYDLFISHATPDKPWVRTLTRELEALGLRVYLDEAEIRPATESVELTPTELGTVEDLIETAKRVRPAGLHFSGHGAPGRLQFEDDEGRSHDVGIAELTGELKRRPTRSPGRSSSSTTAVRTVLSARRFPRPRGVRTRRFWNGPSRASGSASCSRPASCGGAPSCSRCASGSGGATRSSSSRASAGWARNLGSAYARLGEVEKAIGYFEQALRIGREIKDPQMVRIASSQLEKLRGSSAS